MKEHRKTSKFKAQVVLELLKGENLDELSRKYAVTMSEINAWRDEFIRNGTDGFKRRTASASSSATIPPSIAAPTPRRATRT